ncbi:ATP-binding protein [Acidovorax sp. LjRoot129]|uniref:AAA family ATPase n=1 Tax=unclassified Acidovorax TaxID=2684926 RepID=UPI003ECD715C
MSLTVSPELIAATKSSVFQANRQDAQRVQRDIVINTEKLIGEGMSDLIAAAQAVQDNKTARALESILLARAGKFDKPVPNFKAFQAVLLAFLKSDLIDGWIYVSGPDEKLYPQLVTNVTFESGQDYRRNGTPTVTIETASYGFSRDGNYKATFGVFTRRHAFHPQIVAKRRVADILAEEGIYKETHALKAAHQSSLKRHNECIQSAFAEQFRITGKAFHCEARQGNDGDDMTGRRVVHDLESKDYGAVVRHTDSTLFDSDDGVGQVPEHPVVRVFDLSGHSYYWVHADNMGPYVYDETLRHKLVLPDTHRDLLDVLTTDLDAFVNDFIEAKSATNVILCKGVAGVGKTLTAEVYAELIKRPLYAIHAGTLGTTAEEIEKNLKTVFDRATRWDCVLLLDEADVFVVKRGDSIEQNAIVAVFLRVLEYTKALMFMTSNRANDIDDAIISRCAAIIDYTVPGAEDAAAIWRVMATQFNAELTPDLIAQLVDLFPGIAPRDIKMLLRLALRVSKAHGDPLDVATFRRCAMFRAITMKADT